MIPSAKFYLQKLKFLSGMDPVLKKRNDWRSFIPEPYEAMVLISADFELAWASRYSKKQPDPLKQALKKAKTERENVPAIISLSEKYKIPITWITIGHLFLESCSRERGNPHPEIPRPGHFENEWWKYTGNDWFEHDPCTDYKTDPLWYCPDLIELILKSNVHHEIGCHTFSHIDCRDSVCSAELFRAEINASRKAALSYGIDRMESFVHPGHTIGNLDTLAELGFTNYRTDYSNILGYPKKHANGLWEFSTTLELEYKSNWPIQSQINRYIDTLKRALRNHSSAYFWFHPSCNRILVDQIMPPVFKWLDKHREEIWISKQGEYINWLNRPGFK